MGANGRRRIVERCLLAGAAPVALALGAPCALAHHSPAAYDQRAEITIEGTVVRYEWANPHVYVHLRDTTDAARVWVVESNTPTSLRRAGWSATTIVVGERVTIVARPPANRQRFVAFGRSLRKADGAMLMMNSREGAPPAAAAAVANGLAGIWETQPPSADFPRFAGAGFNLPLTEKGSAAYSSFSEAAYAVADCMPPTAPALMQTPLDLKRIDVSPTQIRIASDYWWGTQRTVHLERAAHDGAAPSLQGDSIGRWEDGVLVIDTALFAEYAMGIGRAVPSGARKHLVERLAPAPDGKSLTYSFVLEDPEYLAVPVSGEQQWAYRSDAELEPVPCDLESARRFRQE
jgi:hypothetical protein